MFFDCSPPHTVFLFQVFSIHYVKSDTVLYSHSQKYIKYGIKKKTHLVFLKAIINNITIISNLTNILLIFFLYKVLLRSIWNTLWYGVCFFSDHSIFSSYTTSFQWLCDIPSKRCGITCIDSIIICSVDTHVCNGCLESSIFPFINNLVMDRDKSLSAFLRMNSEK